MICISRRRERISRSFNAVMSFSRKKNLACRGFEQPQQQPADGRLAAARLADQRQRLALGELEAHAVDGLHGLEVLHQVFRPEQRGHSGARQQATE
jgi:hypothetical protein